MQSEVGGGKVDNLAARSAYEVSKLPDDAGRRALAAKVVDSGLTNKETAIEVRHQKKGRERPRKPGGIRQEFLCENGWKLVASSKKKSNYHELEDALLQALEDVRARIRSGLQMF